LTCAILIYLFFFRFFFRLLQGISPSHKRDWGHAKSISAPAKVITAISRASSEPDYRFFFFFFLRRANSKRLRVFCAEKVNQKSNDKDPHSQACVLDAIEEARGYGRG